MTMSDMQKENIQAWSAVWRRPVLTTFVDLFPENYDDAILEFWQTELTERSGHVVDLACGNGALAWIANSLLNNDKANVQITGIDLADIDPFSVLQRKQDDHPNVRFIGNTSIESLPFADSSIDHVISQYGIEYSDLTKTIPEILRVLNVHARISLVLHHADSLILKNSFGDLEDIRFTACELALHDDLLLFLDLIEEDIHAGGRDLRGHAEKRSLLMREIREKTRIANMKESSGRKGAPIHWYLSLLDHAMREVPDNRIDEKRAKIIWARDTLIDHIQRMDALKSAAMTDEDVDRLSQSLIENGFAIRHIKRLLYGDKEDIGVALSAAR